LGFIRDSIATRPAKTKGRKAATSITDRMTEYLAEDEKFTTRKFRVPDTFQLSAFLPSMAF
jgi:hypothetical protein